MGGPALIDENSRLVLFEGIVKELIAGRAGFGGLPGLLAPSLAAAVADMVEELSSAGVSPERLAAAVAASEVSDKPQVKLLLEAYERYAAILGAKDLADPAGMLGLVAERFDPAWLSGFHSVIIDGLHDATALQAEVLRKIAARDGCTFLVEAVSADGIRNAADHHPLSLTREFAARTGLLLGSGPASADEDDRFLAGALFTDRPWADASRDAPAAFGRDLRLLSAVNVREEVSFIGRMVKGSIAAGTPPDSILVAFPSLDEYGPLAEEIFGDLGIPYNRALGRQLGTSPVATAVISLLRTAQDDCSGPSLLAVFSSPFLDLGAAPGTAQLLDRFLRRQRIAGGKDRLLSALRRHAPSEEGPEVIRAPFGRLAEALAPFTAGDTAPLRTWMDRLAGLLDLVGIAGRVATVKGPLNINLQAFRKLTETFTSLRQAGTLFPEYRFTFSEWLFLLKKTLLHARYQVPPDDEGGVQVLGMEEIAGHAWREIYAGGLVDGAFPQRLPQNIFLPEAVLEPLGVATLGNARKEAAFHFYRLMLSAPRVTLTWPENVGDKPVVPSPFLQELAPLRDAKVLNRGIERTAGIRFSLEVEESRSIPELSRSLALAGTVTGLDEVLKADIEGMSGLRAALGAPSRRMPGVPGRDARIFRVTELDAYLTCPYDYYVGRVLGMAPLEEVTEDLSPLERGSIVHGILADFYRRWDRPVTPQDRPACRELLAELADRAFVGSDTFRNRRERTFFLSVMAERFLDAEEAVWRLGFRPAYLEQEIASFPLELAEGATVELHGIIDRIDVDGEGNFIIVDYKTGTYPRPKEGTEQEIFQLPVYAVMAMHALKINTGARLAVPLQKPAGLAYYDLSGRTGALCRDVVLYDEDAGIEQTATMPKASRKTAGEFGEILDRSIAKARQAVEGIRAGEFRPRPKDENKCRYCPIAMMCEKEI
jgi:ATP-dependent helicase/DNAse subunit B